MVCLVLGGNFLGGEITVDAAQKYDVNSIIVDYLDIKENNQLETKNSRNIIELSYDEVLKSDNNKLIDFFEKRDELFLNRATEYGYSYETINRDININKVEEVDAQLKAYICVNEELQYYINGVKEPNLSYITTNYIFTLEKDEDNKLYILDFESDDIEEMTLKNSNMDFVLEQDKLRIKKEKEEFQKATPIVEQVSPHSINGNFNRSAMYNYAKSNYNKFNSNWGNFEDLGGDCTNFISQILYAGGAPMDTTGSYTWYYYRMSNRAPSWTGVNQLYTYLINNDYIGPQGKLAGSSEILYSMNTGDIVQIDFNYDGIYDHSVAITSYQSGNSSSTKVAAHTSPAFDKLLSSYGGSKRYIKLTGYYK